MNDWVNYFAAACGVLALMAENFRATFVGKIKLALICLYCALTVACLLWHAWTECLVWVGCLVLIFTHRERPETLRPMRITLRR